MQFLGRKERGAPALHHVGKQHRAAEGLADTGEILGAAGAFDEEDVGARFEKGLAAEKRLIEAQSTRGISAGDDDEPAGLPRRLDGDGDAAGSRLARHHPAMRGMAAFLGKFLILDLQPGRPRFRIAAHGVGHIEQTAIAGIGIGEEGKGHAAGKQGELFAHFAKPDQPGIGQSMGRGAHPVAGEIEGGKPRLLREQGGEPVEDAGEHQGAWFGKQGAESPRPFFRQIECRRTEHRVLSPALPGARVDQRPFPVNAIASTPVPQRHRLNAIGRRSFRGGYSVGVQWAISSRARSVVGGPSRAMTRITTPIAPAMKAKTAGVPPRRSNSAMMKLANTAESRLQE